MSSTTISFKSRWQHIAGSVLISPIVLAFVLSFALISVPQFREIYVRAAEPGNGWQLLAGLIAMGLLSTSLFFGYLSGWWGMRRAGIGVGRGLIYPDTVLIKDERRVVAIRDLSASLCAAAPFLGVCFGLRSAASELADRLAMIEAAALQTADAGRLLPLDLASMPAEVQDLSWVVGGLALVVVIALNIGGRLRISDGWIVGWQRMLDRLGFATGLQVTYPSYPGWRRWMPFQWRQRMRTRIPRSILALFILMLLGAPLALAYFPELFNAVFRAIGPLATLGLALTALATLLFVIGDYSRKSGVPIMLLIVLVTLFWGIIRYIGQDTTAPSQHKPSAENGSTRDHNASALKEQFRNWLETRADRKAFEGRKYPVFVIAAQGGGIYAAGSATAVLAQMQDTCSNFAQHVFAISSVSGGSLGSALFAGNTDQPQSTTACEPAEGKSLTHTEQTRRVVRDDHLSATMAAAVPDILYNLGSLLAHELGAVIGREMPPQTYVRGRAEALECSFLMSYYRHASPSPVDLANICRKGEGAPKPSRGIGASAFETAWPSRSSAAPALVLNTTRTETGDRVAYSPFALKRVGDGTLLAFSELECADVKATVLEAAVTSARFPAMMPAKIIPCDETSAKRDKPTGPRQHTRWRNFVDGGYADSSGATTALEIYHDLLKAVRDSKNAWAQDVDLRLVLLTDDPSTNGNEPPGDGLVHAISPLITLFSVRSQMARRAVNRALEDVRALEDAEARKDAGKRENSKVVVNAPQKSTGCGAPDWRVRLVVLDQQSFSLPLGWMISTPTAMLVERMVGTPARLAAPPPPLELDEVDPQKRAIARAANILYNNSCTMYSMTRLLAGDTEPIEAAPTAPLTPAQP